VNPIEVAYAVLLGLTLIALGMLLQVVVYEPLARIVRARRRRRELARAYPTARTVRVRVEALEARAARHQPRARSQAPPPSVLPEGDLMSTGPRYIPIDELLQRPDVRALRALRWFDWVTAEEIGDTLGLPPPDESPQRNTLVAAITRLVNRGEIQRRPARTRQPRRAVRVSDHRQGPHARRASPPGRCRVKWLVDALAACAAEPGSLHRELAAFEPADVAGIADVVLRAMPKELIAAAVTSAAHAVLVQRGISDGSNALSGEIGNNAAATVLLMLEVGE
jgi:hypothetical protein